MQQFVVKIGRWLSMYMLPFLVRFSILLVVSAVALRALSASYEKRTMAEWASKVPDAQRSAKDIRSIMDNMIRYRSSGAPSFMAQSLWDDAMCAEAVVKAGNFILGKNLLKSVPAWHFYAENKEHLVTVYDRSKDFNIRDGHIVEIKDRSFQLSKLVELIGEVPNRSSKKMYVIGYRYHETQSDPLILASLQKSETGLNSHLMLLLGRGEGTWWGYHLFRASEDPHASPFRIEDIGEDMPKRFDLVYIWEVRDTSMPREGSQKMAFSRTRPFESISPWLGKVIPSNGYIEQVVDGAVMRFVADPEQFPVILDMSPGVINAQDMSDSRSWRGKILGFWNGVPVQQKRGASQRGTYGLEYECVEFVNRYYATKLHHKNMTRSGNADSYFYLPKEKGLQSFPNGGTEKPCIDDILVFDRDGLGGDPGHAGVITSVEPHQVCIAEQSAPTWYTCLPVKNADSSWYVGPVPGSAHLPVVGWSRKQDEKERSK